MIVRAVRIVALVAIVLGIVARFDSLDRKVFWTDETFSALRVFGHVQNDLYASFDGKIHAADALLALQRDGARRDARATIASLREEPQRGPLYYLAARFWTRAFGDDVRAMRALSASLGACGIALAFFLGRRVAGTTGGYLFSALVALSPIEIRFSQQFREYVLVADATLLTAWLLLRALDRPTPARFVAYACAATLALYANPTAAFVLGAQAVVAFYEARARDRTVAIGFASAFAAAACAYAPWALVAARASDRASSGVAWAAGSYGLGAVATKWIFNVGAVFFDTEYANARYAIALVPALALVGFAAFRAVATVRTSLPSRLGIALVLATIVPFVAFDALRHAHFALVTRYHMSSWIGIDLLVTLALANLLGSERALRRRAGALAFASVACIGAIAALVDRTYDAWWDNNDHLSERAVGAAIGAGPPGLVVASDAKDGVDNTFVLVRYLDARTPVLLTDDDAPRVAGATVRAYLFAPSARLARAIGRDLGAAPRNVSPIPAIAAHDLNAARSGDPMRAENALWIVERPRR